MNRRPLLAAAPLALAALALAACAQRIYQVSARPFGTEEAPLEIRQNQILRAGAGLGWQMEVEGPGRIVATLNLRSHTAVTNIAFNTRQFSILYAESRNLQASGELIHKNYNGWVRNLERAITQQPPV